MSNFSTASNKVSINLSEKETKLCEAEKHLENITKLIKSSKHLKKNDSNFIFMLIIFVVTLFVSLTKISY